MICLNCHTDIDCQVKQEIVTDSESSDSDSDSSEDEAVKEKEKEEEVEKELPPKTKNELGLSDLPAVEDMDLKVATLATISLISRFRSSRASARPLGWCPVWLISFW